MHETQHLERLNRLWQKNWPDQLAREPLYPFGEILLTDYLRKRAELTPDKPCLIYYGAELTFQQLNDLSDRFAGFLASRGLDKGDRVAVFLPNCPQFHIVFFGILKLGCVHVPVNPMVKEHEFLHEIGDADPRVIVTLDQLYPLVEAVKSQTGLQAVVVTRFADFLPETPSIPLHPTLTVPRIDCPSAVDLMSALAEQDSTIPQADVGLDDVAALNYTGGTTGLPKGCVHTQRDMVYTAGCAAATSGSVGAEPAVGLGYFPVFWIAGELRCLIVPVFNGATLVLLSRWDCEAALTAIDRYRVTAMSGLVDNYLELMEHPKLREFDLRSLRTSTCVSFGKKLTVEVRRRWQALTGSVLREAAYGMTETHTGDTFTTGLQTGDKDLESQPVFCGLPMPGTQFKIVDFETGEPAPLDKEGEIAIRSPSLMKSYWNKPDETKRAIRNGWLHTGDIGLLDAEGFLHFLGRRKEMLKVRGMSVFPAEIEALLGRHPAVAGSGVVGKADPEKGQVPVAFVTLNPDCAGDVTAEELALWCRENMATYKVPIIRIVQELPMTATGKVKKEELRKAVE